MLQAIAVALVRSSLYEKERIGDSVPEYFLGASLLGGVAAVTVFVVVEMKPPVHGVASSMSVYQNRYRSSSSVCMHSRKGSLTARSAWIL